MNETKPTVDAWPLSDGEMAACIRAHDWAATPLGPIAEWPERLKAAVDNLLASGFASHLWWGPDLVQIYNDAALAIMRAKHPQLLGMPAREGWAEIWPELAPLIERVLSTGLPETRENLPLLPERGGAVEPAYFTVSFSALRDGSGAIAGTLATAIETTERVRAEAGLREAQGRQAFLLALGDAMRAQPSAEAIIEVAGRLLAERLNPSRVVFAEFDETNGTFKIFHAWLADGATPFPVVVPQEDFRGPNLDGLHAGRTLRVDDAGEPPFERPDYAALAEVGIKAALSVPLIIGGRLMATLSLHQDEARRWTDEEVSLLQEVAERLWADVVRARTEQALRESERLQSAMLEVLPLGLGLMDTE